MKNPKKHVLIILLIVSVIASFFFVDRLVITYKATRILKQEIGERYKTFYVDSIQKDEGITVIRFVNKDMHVLGSHFLVILKPDGTSEIIHGE